jgi:hypothetical protein
LMGGSRKILARKSDLTTSVACDMIVVKSIKGDCRRGEY